MLTFLAYALVAVFMTLIMTRRLSPLTALILVPVAFAIIGGFAADMGPMMLDGITRLAPTGIMLMFAILYFAIMIDTGLFEPFVRWLVRVVHGDPTKVVMGTAALALLVSLDGDGSTTYMITTAAMLPLYRRLGIRPLVLACVAMLSSGVMNVLPWGGPSARAASALAIDVADIFVPMVPAMLICIVWIFYVAYRLGNHERRRLAAIGGMMVAEVDETLPDARVPVAPTSRGRMAVNAVLTAVLLLTLVTAVFPLPVLFMIAFAIALLVNFRTVAEQKGFLANHAGNVLAVVGLIFAAGVFTGILSGTKMVDAMAESVIRIIPAPLGPYLSVVTGVLSIPFTFFISNDAFYFGVLPILAKAGQSYGITAAEMGRASIIGQPVHLLSPLVPSTFLLVGLVGVDFDEHQRFTLKWALLTSFLMLAAGLVTAVIPVVGRALP
ncbi:MAG: citrate transporter [Cytophagaceae bacterium]|nr:citrate transporter [Gemmatimonadaceae bacterium]